MENKKNYQKSPYILILAGMLGLVLGLYFIYGIDAFNFCYSKPKAKFSEISFTPKCPPKDTLCGKILSFESDANNQLYIGYCAHDSVQKTRKVKDTITKNGKLDTVWVQQPYYADTVDKAYITQAQLDADYRKHYNSDIDFCRKNPVFTIWVVFIVAMVVVWLASVIPLFVYIKQIADYKPFENYKPQWIWYYVFSAVMLLIFHLLLLFSVMDSTPFSTFLFLPDFDDRFLLMNAVGIICLSPVFAGMMLIYKLAAEQTEANTDNINYLKQKLKVLLLFLSISFSFVLITTALLQTGINKLEFVAKATADLKFNPIHNDFVISYGALYSLLIAIFYFPVAMRINFLQQNQATGTSQTDDKGGKLPKIDGTLKTVFGEILKSSAPLATSIIASLLGILFQ